MDSALNLTNMFTKNNSSFSIETRVLDLDEEDKNLDYLFNLFSSTIEDRSNSIADELIKPEKQIDIFSRSPSMTWLPFRFD